MSEGIDDQRSISGNTLSMPVNSLKLSIIRNPILLTTNDDFKDNIQPVNNEHQTSIGVPESARTLLSLNRLQMKNKLYPFQITACALLYAWIYTILPTENFWIYNCVKQQLWAFLCLAAYIELQEVCLPDIPDDLYILCYVVGFWTPILFNIIAYEISPRIYAQVEILAVTSGIMIVVILYGIHTVYRPHGEFYGQESKFRSDCSQTYQEASESWMTIVMQNDLTGTLYDTFAVACSHDKSTSTQDSPNADEEAARIESSDGRQNWHYVSRVFMKPHLKQEKKHLQDEEENHHHQDPPRYAWDSLAIFQYFCCLLPRYQFRKLKIPLGIVFGDRRAQWFYISLYNCLFNGFFYFLALFTDYFLSANNQNVVVLFFYFIVGASVLRSLLKRTALVLERRKLGSISMYFVAEFMGLMFYYTYYRLLFESISHVWEFVLFQVMHLLSEWMMYPIRYSRPVVAWMLWIQGDDPISSSHNAEQSSSSNRKNCQLSLIPKRVNYDDLQQFVALDFGLRILVMISTAIGVLVMTLTIDYSWWIDNKLRRSGEAVTINSIYLCVAIVLEIINAFIINEVYFKPQKLSIWKKTLQFFVSSPRTALLSWILAAILFINPIYSFTRGNHFS